MLQVFDCMIVILSLFLLCSSTENKEISTSIDQNLFPVKQLKKHIVHVLLKYLDIPAGFAFISQNKLLYSLHYPIWRDHTTMLKYASKYFTALTTKQVPCEKPIETTRHHQDGSITTDWVYCTHSVYPTIHLAYIPTLRTYSNFLRTVPNPAELYTDMHQLFFTSCKPTGILFTLCCVPEEMRDTYNAAIENNFKCCWGSDEKINDVDHTKPIILSDAPFGRENRYLRMLYNPLTTRLCQYAGKHDGRLLMSWYIQIPALLIFSAASDKWLILLCDLRCLHWYDDVHGNMIIYWEPSSMKAVFEMRFDSSSGHLRAITVRNVAGESAQFTLTEEDPYVLTGSSFGNGFNKIDIFYYPSIMHNE